MIDYAGALAACAKGDRASLRQIYDVEGGRLLSIALRIVRRREIAEDVLHDAFLSIWRRAGTFDPALGSARGWIYAIVRNRALNTVRDNKREEVSTDGLEAPELETEAVIIDAVERLSLQSQLRKCLEQLDAQKRQSVLLSYVVGFSHGEIAGRLGVPLGTAKSWVKRGLAELKGCMG